jgi:hypothetical protein
MLRHQPANAFAAGFFVGGEDDDEVPVRDEAFLLVADEVGHQHRGAVLHIAGAAAVVPAILLDELVGIGGPVLLARVHHVEVGHEEDRLLAAGDPR